MLRPLYSQFSPRAGWEAAPLPTAAVPGGPSSWLTPQKQRDGLIRQIPNSRGRKLCEGFTCEGTHQADAPPSSDTGPAHTFAPKLVAEGQERERSSKMWCSLLRASVPLPKPCHCLWYPPVARSDIATARHLPRSFQSISVRSEPYNRGMAWVGRDLYRSSDPIPLP